MEDDTYLGSELQTSKTSNKSLDYAQSSGLCSKFIILFLIIILLYKLKSY